MEKHIIIELKSNTIIAYMKIQITSFLAWMCAQLTDVLMEFPKGNDDHKLRCQVNK